MRHGDWRDDEEDAFRRLRRDDVTPRQRDYIETLCRRQGVSPPNFLGLTKAEASREIERLRCR